MNKFPNFPLYTSLKKDDFDELKNEEKDELAECIKNMEEEKQSIIYALIRAYHLDHDNNIQEIPYGGKLLKSGHKFDIDTLPSKLQVILYNFSKIKE